MNIRTTLVFVFCALGILAGSTDASSIKIDGKGIKGGLNWSSWVGDDTKIVLEYGMSPELKARSARGYTIGGFVTLGLTDIWAIQPEVLYTTRGTYWKMSPWKGTVKIAYLEIPLLLRAELMPHSHTGHQLYLGPSFSIPVSAKFKQAPSGYDGNEQKIKYTRSPGIGLVLGGAIDMSMGGIKWVFDMRYNYGVTKLASSSAPVDFPNGPFSGDAEPGFNMLRDADVHEKGFSILLGISF